MQTQPFHAKKSLGQNFLHAPHVVGKMIHAAHIGAENTVLEVGPGKGVLTTGLLETGAKVIAMEKDDRAIPFLQEKFKKEIETGKLILLHGDILEFDPHTMPELIPNTYIIAANIPYYITGEFLRKFLESGCQPKSMVLMLQKEVAKRIVGEKGKNDKLKESILSMSVKAYGMPKYVGTVPARAFRPVPNVDSAILYVENISKDFFKTTNIEEATFFNTVKTGFAHKRKILASNLGISQEKWKETDLPEKIRAEELTLSDWGKVTAFIARQNLL
jgi:16S rRNA (adenine1518-N6/adenine1519-N6)-dimethyltransferase